MGGQGVRCAEGGRSRAALYPDSGPNTEGAALCTPGDPPRPDASRTWPRTQRAPAPQAILRPDASRRAPNAEGAACAPQAIPKADASRTQPPNVEGLRLRAPQVPLSPDASRTRPPAGSPFCAPPLPCHPHFPAAPPLLPALMRAHPQPPPKPPTAAGADSTDSPCLWPS